VTARVEIAELDISEHDIANLEPGDIIIVENHQVTKTPESLDGTVEVKLGHGENGLLLTRVYVQDDLYRLELIDVAQQEQPVEEQMDSEHDEYEGEEHEDYEEHESEEQHQQELSEAGGTMPDNLEQTEGLLRDVPAPVVVELGRIRMNTAQVVRLRPGQVLRLPRGPNDPVDLVVNDKLFARAELVEVDGELGVRLIKVVGTP
jgi:type III secretion system YscQ/HrcQ family protein